MRGAGSGDGAVRQRPVEGNAGIGLAPGSDVAMPGKTRRLQARIGSAERRHHLRQGVVLTLVVRVRVGTLELNADREIVARLPALVFGDAGMPRAVIEADVLGHRAVAAYAKVRRHPLARDLREIRMRIGRQRFILLSTCSAVLWVGSWLAAGVLFKLQIKRLLGHLGEFGGIAAAGVVILLAAYVAFKWWERTRFYKMLRMARISVADLYELIRTGAEPQIVDVRSFTARALEPRWIPGALHVPLQDVATHLKHLPRDRDIILYCACPSEATAARVAKLLMNHGFKKVRPLYGGLDAWVAAGYAVEHGS